MKKVIPLFIAGVLAAILFTGCASTLEDATKAISDAKQASSAVSSSSSAASSSVPPSSAPVPSSSSVPQSSSSQAAPVPPSSSAASPSASSAAQPAAAEGLSKPFFDVVSAGKYTMKCRIDAGYGPFEITQYVSGDKLAVIGKTQDADTRIIFRDGKAYMIDDTSKMMFESPSAEEAEGMTVDMDGIVYKGNGTEDFLGKVLSYDEYTADGGTLRMYVDGNRLVGMKHTDEFGETVIEILEFSDKVDESVFELPTGYQIIS